MNISIIAAVSQNNVIGKNNQLPWNMPADLAHFKKITTGHCVIMGKTTFKSIGSPLPNRTNIVMTLDKKFRANGIKIAHSPKEAIKIARKLDEKEAMIIGGATIYRLFLPKANKIYLTLIKHNFTGDTYFPKLNMAKWKIVSTEKHYADSKNPYDYEFQILEKND